MILQPSWDEFLKRTFDTLLACDFFSKEIITPLGKKLVYALFFINIRTRKVHLAGITQNPNEKWIIEHTKNLSEIFEVNKSSKNLLIRDGDKKFTKKFDNLFKEHNIEPRKLPYRSPNLNAYAESWVKLIKYECLNKFFIFGETHFKYIVDEYLKYYNSVRPHGGLDHNPLEFKAENFTGDIKCDSRLGGVLNHYYRE